MVINHTQNIFFIKLGTYGSCWKRGGFFYKMIHHHHKFCGDILDYHVN